MNNNEATVRSYSILTHSRNKKLVPHYGFSKLYYFEENENPSIWSNADRKQSELQTVQTQITCCNRVLVAQISSNLNIYQSQFLTMQIMKFVFISV